MFKLKEFFKKNSNKNRIGVMALIFCAAGGAFFLPKYFQRDQISNFKCGDVLRDFEKNSYATVEIAGKCWMKQYLKSTKDSQGRIVQRNCYDKDESKCDELGGLYTYQTAFNGSNNGQEINGICPDGWRIPSESDYNALLDLYSKDKCDLPENDATAICDLNEELLFGNVFAVQYGGSCDLLCNYQNCSHICSGLNCRSASIYTVRMKDSEFSTGKRIVINNCDPVKGKADSLVGGADSLISVRCVKK
jgi:uncharacterized protein (TIGR02145 family)